MDFIFLEGYLSASPFVSISHNKCQIWSEFEVLDHEHARATGLPVFVRIRLPVDYFAYFVRF